MARGLSGLHLTIDLRGGLVSGTAASVEGSVNSDMVSELGVTSKYSSLGAGL